MNLKSKGMKIARKRILRVLLKRTVKWLALPLPARIAVWAGIPVATWGYRRYRKRQQKQPVN